MASHSGEKRKVRSRTIIEKYEILKEIEKGESCAVVSRKHNIPKQTLSGWMKEKSKIYDAVEKNRTSTKKYRMRGAQSDDIDKAYYQWLISSRHNNLPVNRSILKHKALFFGKELGLEDFQASYGWLDRWKKRYNVSFKAISDEGRDVNTEMTAPWKETTLPTILSNSSPHDIFNADEFGLFYRALPTKTLHLKGQKCSRGEHSTIRLTGLAAANMAGEKLPMFVIGKSKKPRCFKNVKSLPCRYRGQNKSWMSSERFEEWVRGQDKKFECEGRKVALVIDNCPAHPSIENLKSIYLYFLPPNATSVLQPMDQGVIRSLKAKYRTRVIKRMIAAVDQEKQAKPISILEAMKILVLSWGDITSTTIVNCFRKGRFSGTAVSDEDDPFANLNEALEELKQRDGNAVPEVYSPKDLVSVDDDVTVIPQAPSDAEILEEIRGETVEVEEDDDDEEDQDVTEDEAPVKPSNEEVRQAIETLLTYSMFTENGEIGAMATKISSVVESELTRCLKQVTITDFFKKQ